MLCRLAACLPPPHRAHARCGGDDAPHWHGRFDTDKSGNIERIELGPLLECMGQVLESARCSSAWLACCTAGMPGHVCTGRAGLLTCAHAAVEERRRAGPPLQPHGRRRQVCPAPQLLQPAGGELLALVATPCARRLAGGESLQARVAERSCAATTSTSKSLPL